MGGGLNYYPFHLGDYAAHTAHLDPMEDLAYRRMLDLYYRTEQPLPEDLGDIARLIRMKDYGDEIDQILMEFFTLTDNGWAHTRCDAEIAKMQDKQAKAKASAQASVNARSANAQRTLNGRSAKVELPTPTPTPTPKEVNTPPNPRKRGSAGCPGFDAFWSAYPRKTAKPAAQKAFYKLAPSTDLLDELLEAIARQKHWPAWTKDEGQFVPHPATWLNGRRWEDQAQGPPAVPFESAKTRAARERVFAMTGGILGKPPTKQPEIFDADAGHLTALG